MSELIPITTPLREFKGHEERVTAVAVFLDKRLMVTGSLDKTLRLWDLKTGKMLKKMEGHCSEVMRLAVSRDGQLVASGHFYGEIIVWHGETGESLTNIKTAHTSSINSLDFSPDGTVLATGSKDKTTKLWNTQTWRQQGNIKCYSDVNCVRYSPSHNGELLAIAADNNIQIYNPNTKERVASFKGHAHRNLSLAWTPDGTRLLTGGDKSDSTIHEWDASTWKQVDDPWLGHTMAITSIAINPAGTLVASVSDDRHVRLWRLSDRRTMATFKHTSQTVCVTFSVDGNHILSGGGDKMISEWAPQACLVQILAITTARIACIVGDLSTAEKLLTQDINTNPGNMTGTTPFKMQSRRSIRIQPSYIGYISTGIALCGKGNIWGARAAFDVASVYTDQNSETIHFLLLIKVIALFNADQHDEANLLLKALTNNYPNADTQACHIVEAYLRVQLGINALDGGRHGEAADYFTAALNSSHISDIHETYEDLIVLFGWDLKSLWLTAHQKRCHALFRARKLQDALKSYQCMMDNIDDRTKASCLEWSKGKSGVRNVAQAIILTRIYSAFMEECRALCLAIGDAALAASKYDQVIDLCSAVIDLGFASDVIFANRSKARLERMLWEDALLDAQKVTELNPSSHIGYELTHTALHGAKRYDEAIETFKIMLSKLENSSDPQVRDLRQQYVSPSEVEDAIQNAVSIELSNAPLRLLNTYTGLLCDRTTQINSFKTSPEYKELLSFTTKHSDLQMERIEEVVMMYFRCVLLSHRWDETEALLENIQDKDVRELEGFGGIAKLQSFCKVARNARYRWAWMDTCCIDKNNNVELQQSINTMFVWYRHSALTIVYLSDVPPASQRGALARSVWNKRGWTFQEFVAPKAVRFYQEDWSLYLDDRSSNHKESPAIMEELEGATGIDSRALISFRPGMRDARVKLQWASSRVTTLQEDIAYSLFGIFGVHLPVIYGEKKQNALGRLLQEIVARSGDITALDWVGQSSEFNSCLPADIISYAAPPYALPSLSEDEIQTRVSSLRNIVTVDLASKLYNLLENMATPRFANCRLHLPCIAFRVTEIRRRRDHAAHPTYGVKADGLRDLVITTNEMLIQFSRTRPTRQTFFLVRPWDRRLIELPDFAEQPVSADEVESVDDWSESEHALDDTDESSSSLPGEEELSVDSEAHLRSLRLMVHLGQEFSALLLAQQRVGEYKRIASDHHIIAQVKDTASIDIMDIKTLDIV
ncbi:uncharacterized protein EDB93DRAFT_1250323 [Suillus bovinus]|uniref:uncharacterized protein n=1 Tax=Suillus bovinus TaxID=48563 RepID=UPI001B8617D6|nr:uncharacterized protein EDB93DRAFT_1250323 [Suillus bovinus]KAG2147810.1 hypothetical protein EDB93DRAFT_1250323 [Suillus bovinus]